MKKIALFSTTIFTLSLSNAASSSLLSENTSYNMFIRADTSCYILGDCNEFFNSYTDNGDLTIKDGISYGSSIAGDGWAGVIKFQTDATGSNFTITSYNLDAMPLGPPDRLYTWADDTSQMSGAIDSTGNMSFSTEGRMGIASFFPTIGPQPYNINDSSNVINPSNEWATFTTGTASTSELSGFPNDIISLAGQTLTSDGNNGWNATFVSAGNMGDSWSFFTGTPYTEVWDVSIQAAVVPVPSAFWLFGTGLVCLVNFSKRKSNYSRMKNYKAAI